MVACRATIGSGVVVTLRFALSSLSLTHTQPTGP